MKVETYKVKGWDDLETGLLVDENEDWILIKQIPIDYLVDGYKLIRKKHVVKRIEKTDEKQIKKALKLKGVKAKAPKGFKFGTALEMLQWSQRKYGLFEFQDHLEGELFYGQIAEYSKKELVINAVDAEGDLDKDFDIIFSLKKIRTIAFESDYFKTIALMMK